MKIRPRNDLESNIISYYSKEEPLRKVLSRSQEKLAKGMLTKISNILNMAGYDGSSNPSILLKQADPQTIRELERIANGLPDNQRRKVLSKLYGQIGTGGLTVRRAIRDVMEFDTYNASIDLYDKGKRALRGVTEDAMLRGEFMVQKSVGIGWQVESPGLKRVDAFIDRRWTQNDATQFLKPMSSIVQDQVSESMLLGEHPNKLSKRIQNVEEISAVRANRMARTTVTAVSNEAHMDSYKKNGVKRYEFRAMFNERTCDKCGALDGRTFNLDDKRPGVNFPPIHPNCRCTTAAALSKDVKDRLKENAIKNGHKLPLRDQMTFEEWREKNVGPIQPKKPKDPTTKTKRAETKKKIDERLYPKTVANVERNEKGMTFEEADGGRANPMRLSDYDKPYDVNCQTCVVANEMRRRGYNVQATGKTKGSLNEELSYDTAKAWLDPETGEKPSKLYQPRPMSAEESAKWLDETVKEGERYHLDFNWKGKKYGHIITMERSEKGVRLFDPQTGKIVAEGQEEVAQYMSRTNTNTELRRPAVLRVDDKIPNPHYTDEVLTKAMSKEEFDKARQKQLNKASIKKKMQKDEDTRKWIQENLEKDPEVFKKHPDWKRWLDWYESEIAGIQSGAYQ